jgi:hypothetical protein
MTTQWIHRINIIIPSGDADALNALWTVIAPGGDEEAHTFGLPLSPDGMLPITHRGISTAATETMRLLIIDTYISQMERCKISIQEYTKNDYADLLLSNNLQSVDAGVEYG